MGRYNDPVPIGEIMDPTTRRGRASGGSPMGNGGAGSCRECGARGTWHASRGGRRLLLENRPVPAERLPAENRWRVAEDGTAVRIESPNPRGHCRVLHFDVCPARRQPQDEFLLSLWQKHHDRIWSD